ncbi:hypothetical protein [Comamonas thiooxydans]|uniref:hypothetical protein n=1 Tax=Comamonas thiooxydans TaxID=363952 RepID=UPI0015A73A32|nr:hypothetical protein [Comamonas thiooxydans]
MNIQIPVKWLQELLALCGPEDHELRERVMASITAMNEQAAGPVVTPEPDAAIKEAMELVGTAMDSAMKAGELLLDSHEKFNAQFASAKSLKNSIESKLRALLATGGLPRQPHCLTCNDHGAVGNILTAEPCPDCTVPAIKAQAEARDAWPKHGDLVRYASGSTALALHGEPHAGGWHGVQCMGGHTFYTKTQKPSAEDRVMWVKCAVRYRGRTMDEARIEAGLSPIAAIEAAKGE